MESSNNDVCSNLRSVFCIVFKVSKIFGIFPFRLAEGKLQVSLRNSIPLAFFEVFLIYSSVTMAGKSTQPMDGMQKIMSLLSTASLSLGVVFIPVVSVGMLSHFAGRLSKTFDSLLRLEKITSVRFQSHNHSILYLMMFAYVSVLVGRLIFGTYMNFVEAFEHDVCFIIIKLTLLQFCCLLGVVRGHLSLINKELEPKNAEEFTKCFEVLARCCYVINLCYAPQLLIIFFSMFINLVCNTYLIVQCIKNSMFHIMVLWSFWMFIYGLIIWYTLYNCQDIISQAAKFNKILYTLVINDDTKVLVRNKRILLHFKSKRKIEFSALGFFNLDYTLICSMVCSATTYIVILFQFAS